MKTTIILCLLPKNYGRFVAHFLIFTFCAFVSSAQQLKFINTVSNESALKLEKSRTYLNTLKNIENIQNVTLVRFGDLPTQQKDGIFTFTLPDNANPITSHSIRVEYQDAKHFSYWGVPSEGNGSIYIKKGTEIFTQVIS